MAPSGSGYCWRYGAMGSVVSWVTHSLRVVMGMSFFQKVWRVRADAVRALRGCCPLPRGWTLRKPDLSRRESAPAGGQLSFVGPNESHQSKGPEDKHHAVR